MTQEILVLGATGKTGRRVVRALESAGAKVRAASRSHGFDWNDESTWKPVLHGVTAAYVIAPEDPALAAPFVELAKASGVRRLVQLSGRGLDETPDEFFQGMRATEEALRASELSWTILRANNFNQNFSEDVWQAEIQAGRLSLPVDDTPEPFVDVQDIAEVAALVLTSGGHDGQTYNLTGPEAITFTAAVEKISAAAGRPVELVGITPDEYRETLLSQGVPEEVAAELNGMFEGMRNGLMATPTDDVSRLLGRPATSFDTYVANTRF
ncbi:NAD(P)H-binding protein [Lentzea sp. PSKA42]|uniref:NAD(P)H-binding protein n=1 Tax=Lentzea indica TaxID=2604800 RepID=A0ABX1FKV0_9PSEU|nr:NAD(P)H-binding protein [Lentzea indica]NKE59616.1 NAD(P)H-binding protein [Lentzea indica]